MPARSGMQVRLESKDGVNTPPKPQKAFKMVQLNYNVSNNL